MTQYVMFESTPEIEKAIEDGDIYDLIPYKVYNIVQTQPVNSIINEAGFLAYIATNSDKFNCPHLNDLAQWQYCDADGNVL